MRFSVAAAAAAADAAAATAAALQCTAVSDSEVNCNGTVYRTVEGKLSTEDTMYWVYLGIYACLVMGAGLMSGLTIGLLSLDLLSLQVLSDSGTGKTKRYAKRLFPIIRRHHWLLVTLLLGNAVCVEAMPIFLDRVSDPITAILVSVTAVLFFGEVIPQALCTRYGLAIGYYCSPIVYICLAVLSPIAYPIAKLLDCLLGTEHETVFKREELKSLVGLHGPAVMLPGDGSEQLAKCTESQAQQQQQQQRQQQQQPRQQLEGGGTVRIDAGSSAEDRVSQQRRTVLTREEVTVIRGVLELGCVTAGEACTDIADVYMLSDNEQFGRDLLRRIAACAHSRIPVYHGIDRNDIRGHLLVKMLLVFDLDDDARVDFDTVLKDKRCFRDVPFVTADAGLFDLLKIFQQGKSHMAIVQRSGQPNIVQGVITLENVLERLLLGEIRDEADEIREELSRMSNGRRMVRNRSSIGRLSRQISAHQLIRSGSHNHQFVNSNNQQANETTPLL